MAAAAARPVAPKPLAHAQGGGQAVLAAAGLPSAYGIGRYGRRMELILFAGLYLLEGVPVTVCAVATVAWEGSPSVAVFG